MVRFVWLALALGCTPESGPTPSLPDPTPVVGPLQGEMRLSSRREIWEADLCVAGGDVYVSDVSRADRSTQVGVVTRRSAQGGDPDSWSEPESLPTVVSPLAMHHTLGCAEEGAAVSWSVWLDAGPVHQLFVASLRPRGLQSQLAEGKTERSPGSLSAVEIGRDHATVAWSDAASSSLVAARSADGFQTWEQSRGLALTLDDVWWAQPPVMTTTSAGQAVLVATATRDEQLGVYAMTLTEQGDLTAPVRLDDGLFDTLVDRRSLSICRHDDEVAVTWAQGHGASDLVVVRSLDGGSTWAPARNVSLSLALYTSTLQCAVRDGDVHVAATGVSLGQGESQVWYGRLGPDDDLQGLTIPVLRPASGSHLQLQVDDGRVVLAWLQARQEGSEVARPYVGILPTNLVPATVQPRTLPVTKPAEYRWSFDFRVREGTGYALWVGGKERRVLTFARFTL